MRSPALGLLFACLAMLGALALWPVHAGQRTAAPASMCLSNLKQTSLALMLYASDHGERVPQRDVWMDAAAPYAKIESAFHCPTASEKAKGVYGYAFNGALSNGSLLALKTVDRTPMVYESVNPVRNASDLVASLPSPGRHTGTPRKNNVAYADGHAKTVAAP